MIPFLSVEAMLFLGHLCYTVAISATYIITELNRLGVIVMKIYQMYIIGIDMLKRPMVNKYHAKNDNNVR